MILASLRRLAQHARRYGCFLEMHPDRFRPTLLAEISTGPPIAIEDPDFSRKVLDRSLHVPGCTRVLERMLVETPPRARLQVPEFKSFSFLCSFVDKHLRSRPAPGAAQAQADAQLGRLAALLLLHCGYVLKADQAFLTEAIRALQRRLPALLLQSLGRLAPLDLLRALHGEALGRNRPEVVSQLAGRLAKLPLQKASLAYLCEALEDCGRAKPSPGLELLLGQLVDEVLARLPALDSFEGLAAGLKGLAASKVNLKDSRLEHLASVVAGRLGVAGAAAEALPGDPSPATASGLLLSLAEVEKAFTHGFLVFEALDGVYERLVAACKRAAPGPDFARICSRLYRALYLLKHFDRHLLLEAVRALADEDASLRAFGLLLRYAAMCALELQADPRLLDLLLAASLQRLARARDQDSDLDHIALTLWSLCILFHPQQIVPHATLLTERLLRLHRDKDMPLYALSMLCTAFEYLKSAYVPPQGISLKLISNLLRLKASHNKEVSMLNLEVVEVLNRLNIPNTVEKKLGILEVDVVVKGLLPQDVEICIDVHGYQHYFRNHDLLLGHNFLKGKMIRQQGFGYFEIALPVWSALDIVGKKSYLLEGITRLRLPARAPPGN